MTDLRWKFLHEEDGVIRSHAGDHTWEIGKWYKILGDVMACESGFHCSPTIVEALQYVRGGVLARVEARGIPDDRGDKAAYPEMRIVRAWRFTPGDAVHLAVYAAELVLPIFEQSFPYDDRPRRAIAAAKAARPLDPRSRADVDRAAQCAASAAEEALAVDAFLESHAAYAAHYAGLAAYYGDGYWGAHYGAEAAVISSLSTLSQFVGARLADWFQERLSSLKPIPNPEITARGKLQGLR